MGRCTLEHLITVVGQRVGNVGEQAVEWELGWRFPTSDTAGQIHLPVAHAALNNAHTICSRHAANSGPGIHVFKRLNDNYSLNAQQIRRQLNSLYSGLIRLFEHI